MYIHTCRCSTLTFYVIYVLYVGGVQWNLSIKDNMNKGHFSNEDTLCSTNHIELCTNLPLNLGHLSIQDSQLGLSAVLYR